MDFPVRVGETKVSRVNLVCTLENHKVPKSGKERSGETLSGILAWLQNDPWNNPAQD
jgi:hypothetical protein